MPESTKNETVKLIGEVLAELDILRAEPGLSAADSASLADLRRRLDDAQRQIAARNFIENTAAFQTAAADLKQHNSELKETVESIEKVAATIASIIKIVGAAEKLLGGIAGAAGSN